MDRTRTLRKHFAATGTGLRLGLFALAICVLLGCKKDTGATTGGMTQHDPLINGPNRIPPQNMPLPERGSAGNGMRTDPLMTPASRTENKVGSGYTEDPLRWKGGPYVPDMGAVPASLASGKRPGDELKIETPTGVPLQPAGGIVPIGDADLAASADRQLQELREYGVAKGSYSFSSGEKGRVIFRANVPNPKSGATQGFTGVGVNPADAVQQVIDQVKASNRK